MYHLPACSNTCGSTCGVSDIAFDFIADPPACLLLRVPVVPSLLAPDPVLEAFLEDTSPSDVNRLRSAIGSDEDIGEEGRVPAVRRDAGRGALLLGAESVHLAIQSSAGSGFFTLRLRTLAAGWIGCSVWRETGEGLWAGDGEGSAVKRGVVVAGIWMIAAGAGVGAAKAGGD